MRTNLYRKAQGLSSSVFLEFVGYVNGGTVSLNIIWILQEKMLTIMAIICHSLIAFCQGNFKPCLSTIPLSQHIHLSERTFKARYIGRRNYEGVVWIDIQC